MCGKFQLSSMKQSRDIVFKKTPTSRPSEMGVVIKMGVAPQECEEFIPNVWQSNHWDLLNTMI